MIDPVVGALVTLLIMGLLGFGVVLVFRPAGTPPHRPPQVPDVPRVLGVAVRIDNYGDTDDYGNFGDTLLSFCLKTNKQSFHAQKLRWVSPKFRNYPERNDASTFLREYVWDPDNDAYGRNRQAAFSGLMRSLAGDAQCALCSRNTPAVPGELNIRFSFHVAAEGIEIGARSSDSSRPENPELLVVPVYLVFPKRPPNIPNSGDT